MTLGGSPAYVATDTFSDGSTADVINLVAWAVSPVCHGVGGRPDGQPTLIVQ